MTIGNDYVIINKKRGEHMPILIVLGIVGIFGANSFIESCQTNAKPKTTNTMERMSSEMIGKSKRECRKILRRYR